MRGKITELWEYRGLIAKIAVTDLKVRYKSSVLGILWSLLQPLLMFLVLYVVFSSVFANRSIQNYPLFLLLGIITWGFLDKASNFSLGSIINRPNLVKKIYFPREVLVISSCLTALMMTAIELIVFGFFMVVFGVMPTALALLFPVLLLIEFILVLGISFAIASLNVIWRDIQWIWAVVMQAGFFVTPIMYSLGTLGNSQMLAILKFNPFGAIMTMMRDTLVYGAFPSAFDLAYAVIVMAVMLILGLAIFQKLEPRFAEEV